LRILDYLVIIILVFFSFQIDFTFEKVIFSNNTADAIINATTLALKKLNKTHQVVKGKLELLVDLGNDYEVFI
jgi:hypothetical protein